MINRHSGCKAQAYGGLVLNWPAGGLNVYAVENALRAGARIIWMPTRDSQNSLAYGDMEGDFFRRPGISILDGGSLKPCIYEIMDIVKANGAVLATGHVSPEEAVTLCREGRKRGVRMVLTHPEFPRTFVEPAVQKELADQGVLIEKCWFNIVQGRVTIQEMAATIRLVGSTHAYITTDRGQKGQPAPVPELRRFIQALLQEGLTPAQVRDLVQTVPKAIIS